MWIISSNQRYAFIREIAWSIAYMQIRPNRSPSWPWQQSLWLAAVRYKENKDKIRPWGPTDTRAASSEYTI